MHLRLVAGSFGKGAIVPKEGLVPDLVQRMLLTGVAVESLGETALLNPALFSDEKQAQKAFEHRI